MTLRRATDSDLPICSCEVAAGVYPIAAAELAQRGKVLAAELSELFAESPGPQPVSPFVAICRGRCRLLCRYGFGVHGREDALWDLFLGTPGSNAEDSDDGKGPHELAMGKNEREVLEFAGGLLQLYAEEGCPDEPFTGFRSRVGLDYLRERLTKDPQGRSVLLQRFFRAQRQRGAAPGRGGRDTTPRAG